MSKTINIKKGDTLWEISRQHHVHWEKIWHDEANRTLREKRKVPERIQPNDSLVIPNADGIEATNLSPGKQTVCIVGRPESAVEIPRFDCHCHVHAEKIYRIWWGLCHTLLSDRQNAAMCNAEADNFKQVSRPGGSVDQVAVVPLLIDMAFGPLWLGKHIESPIHAGLIALFSSTIAKTRKYHREEATYWDPGNIYPPGRYLVCDDDFVVWRDAVVEVHRKNPGYCFPFVSFDPRRPNAIDHVKDCILRLGFVGIKFYSRLGWRVDENAALVGDSAYGNKLDERVHELLHWAEENQVPVLNHCSPGGWPPDEHIAFPNGFSEFNTAETKLREFEQAWYMNALQQHVMTADHVAVLPKDIDAASQIRRAVVAHLKKGLVVNKRSSETLAKHFLDNRLVRPLNYMSEPDFAAWVKLAADYALHFSMALADYKLKTVAPELQTRVLRRFPTLKYCLAHCGSDLIFSDEMKDGKYEQSQEYARWHSADRWLNRDTLNDWLKRYNAYVDISFFCGIEDQATCVEVYEKALRWLHSIGAREKVLFGTDWPLTWLADMSVAATWEIARQAAERITDWPECWNDITRNNPVKFLGLQQDSPTLNRLREFHGPKMWRNTWLFHLENEVADRQPLAAVSETRNHSTDSEGNPIETLSNGCRVLAAAPTSRFPHRGDADFRFRPLNPNRTYLTLLRQIKRVLREQNALRSEVGNQPIVWFAATYYWVTHFELRKILEGYYQYPHMKMLLVLAFHETYKQNLIHWINGRKDIVEPNWSVAFGSAEKADQSWWLLRSTEIKYALVPSMHAHIRFDLPRAIAHVYHREYSHVPGASLDIFKPDFDRMGPVFDDATRAMNARIESETFFFDAGGYTTLRGTGFPFIFNVPMEREHAWEKAKVLIQNWNKPLPEIERQISANQRIRHPMQDTLDVDDGYFGTTITNYDWLGQPEYLKRDVGL